VSIPVNGNAGSQKPGGRRSGAAAYSVLCDQLRDQRGQRRRYLVPFALWVQGGAGMGWGWSWGGKVAAGPAGSVALSINSHVDLNWA
jgi:hypothetical protein